MPLKCPYINIVKASYK